MRKRDLVEVIDETVASDRRAGLLVGLTPLGHLIVEVARFRRNGSCQESAPASRCRRVAFGGL